MTLRSGRRPARPLAYTRIQILLHWLVAALVVLQYATSGAITRTHSMHRIGWRPSPTDIVLHTLHNRVGLAIVALMVGRLALRLWGGVPAPATTRSVVSMRLAQAVHAGFYGVLIIEGVTGAVASYVWWPISTAHVILFKVLLALVSVHIAAALWHQFVRRDAVLNRIGLKLPFPSRKAGREP